MRDAKRGERSAARKARRRFMAHGVDVYNYTLSGNCIGFSVHFAKIVQHGDKCSY